MKEAVRAMFVKFKAHLIAGWVLICLFLLLNALVSNPSSSKAATRLALMQEDMAILLGQGGKVVNETSNAKYGGAFLTRYLSDEGWSDSLLSRYQATLVSRGWSQLGRRPLKYCKDGILATLEPNHGVIDGVGINYVGMTYNAMTIQECADRRR